MLIIIWTCVLLVMLGWTFFRGPDWFWSLKLVYRLALMIGLLAFGMVSVWYQINHDRLTADIVIDAR